MTEAAPKKTLPPPGPWLQALNDVLHTEPWASLVYGFYWSFLIIAAAPFACFFLQVSCLFQFCKWLYEKPSEEKKPTEEDRGLVITGCDSGFGKELVVSSLQAGYTVFAGCLYKDSIEQYKTTAPDKGTPGILIPIQLDVTSDKDVNAAVETVQAWINGEDNKDKKRVLHGLVNNAGVALGGDIDWIEMTDFEKCMDVNYFGLVRCCKAFLPVFKQQSISGNARASPPARILNVASMAGMVAGGHGMGAYSPSKHAAVAFSTLLRNELRSFHIGVTTVNPSFHGTDMVASMTRLYQNVWTNLPAEKREEYGQAYYDRLRFLGVDIPNSFSWDMQVVVRSMMEAIQSEGYPPPELVLGSDAKFGLCVCRMLPAWLLDILLYQLLFVRPIPAVLMQSKATGWQKWSANARKTSSSPDDNAAADRKNE